MEKMPPLAGRSARPSPNRQVRGTGVQEEGEAEGRDDGRTVAGESLLPALASWRGLHSEMDIWAQDSTVLALIKPEPG